MTQRFDRVDGKKLHTQTMAAISSMAVTYEDLFTIGRRLSLTAEEQEQQYRISADTNSHLFRYHELSAQNKRKDFTRQDLLAFASKQDIKNAANIIEDVAKVVAKFRHYADIVGMDDLWTNKIEAILKENIILRDYF